MTKQGAERAVITSALVVFGVYFYRHLTEGTTSSGGNAGQLIGLGAPASIGKFVTAWGFVFFALSMIAEASPGFGGAFAILVAVGDILTNGSQVAADVNKKLGNKTPTITNNSTGPQIAAIAGIPNASQFSSITPNPPPGVTLQNNPALGNTNPDGTPRHGGTF